MLGMQLKQLCVLWKFTFVHLSVFFHTSFTWKLTITEPLPVVSPESVWPNKKYTVEYSSAKSVVGIHSPVVGLFSLTVDLEAIPEQVTTHHIFWMHPGPGTSQFHWHHWASTIHKALFIIGAIPRSGGGGNVVGDGSKWDELYILSRNKSAASLYHVAFPIIPVNSRLS